MHQVFISYHHQNDQYYKEELLRINEQEEIFIDGSVDTGDISDDLNDQEIRKKIRDEYLKDTTVTILLVGLETKKRKHIDWELYSSMIDGAINKKSGIIVINLPSTGSNLCTASHDNEKEVVHPEIQDWVSISERTIYESRYPYMPDRIIDNLLKKDVKISVISWDKIIDHPEKLDFLIDAAYNDRLQCDYDLSKPMRRKDS